MNDKNTILRVIRSLKSAITMCLNEAEALEIAATKSRPVQAAFYREKAEELREMARERSELLLRCEKLLAEIEGVNEA
jgi:hypothetical protein